MDDIHHKQAEQPTAPTSSQKCRNRRRRKKVVRNVDVAMVNVAGTRTHPATDRGYSRTSTQYFASNERTMSSWISRRTRVTIAKT